MTLWAVQMWLTNSGAHSKDTGNNVSPSGVYDARGLEGASELQHLDKEKGRWQRAQPPQHTPPTQALPQGELKSMIR